MSYEALTVLKGMTTKLPLLTASLLIHDVGYYEPQNVEFPHFHLFNEIYFMLQGAATISVASAKLSLEEGELLYISPETTHCCVFNPLQEYSYLILSFELFNNDDFAKQEALKESLKDERDLLGNLLSHPWLHAKDICGCRQEIDSLCLGLAKKYMGEFVKMRSYLLNFFISAIQSFSEVHQRPDFDTIVNVGIVNKAVRIAYYVWNHCSDALTVRSIAAALNYSPRHIQRIISEYFNINFSDLLIQSRVGYAKLLLCTTTASMEIISEKAGFGSSKSLCKHFKASTNLSPSEYRKIYFRSNDRSHLKKDA
jgi:AraC-like DNA-binding protein